MGNQHARPWKYLLFCLAGCIIFSTGLGGCLYYPEKWKSEEHLALSRYYMERRNFKASLRESRTALELFSRSLGDQAFFQIGLIHAHPENPSQNLENSTTAFQKLINNYPNSSLKSQAELWIMYLRRIQDLEATLNARKQEIGKLHNRLNRVKKDQSQNKKLQKGYLQKIKNQKKEIRELKRNIKRSKEIDLKIEEKKRKTIP